MDQLTFSLLPQSGLAGFGKSAGLSGGVAQSRSTSAGSKPSDAQSSAPNSPPQGHSTSALGLPEYEYPTPWAVLRTAGDPAPLLVKNTFIGFDIGRPASLADFYTERHTQSCPASGIGLPPGLEDMVALGESTREIGMMEDREQLSPTDHLLPAGLLDLLGDLESPRSSSPPPQQPPLFDGSWALPMSQAQSYTPKPVVLESSSPPSQQPPLFDGSWALPMLHAQLYTPQPFVLDLSLALCSPGQAKQQRLPLSDPILDQLCLPNRLPPQMWAQETVQATPEAELGSPDCPTVGSKDHWFGTCRPCAFMYTKGCGNGVLCSFCHLCDKDAKKRRSKDKRTALRSSKHSGC